jgi:hypothetical protein
MKNLNNKHDLSRWNRAGLTQFKYVDGNAITFTETLRLAMIDAYTEAGKNKWESLDTATPAPTEESAQQRQARWTKQYQDERRDYSWEILRSYARAGHVLAEHIDRYANESYIGTATQWNNVRRLVEMLDYHPAPAASAQTRIALIVKDSLSGSLEKGFGFKNKPVDGSKPSIYETHEDVDVDAQLNRLKTLDWDQSQISFSYPASGQGIIFPLQQPLNDISVGTNGILLVADLAVETGMAVTVSALSSDSLTLNGENRPAELPSEIKRHQVRLLLKPSVTQAPQLNGANVITLNIDHQFVQGIKIAWQSGSSYKAANVLVVEGNKAQLSTSLPSSGTKMFLAARSNARQVDGVDEPGNRVILPLVDNREPNAFFDSHLNLISGVKSESAGGVKAYNYFDGDSHSSIYYVPKTAGQGPDVIGIAQTAETNDLVFDGDAAELSSNDWVLALNGSTLQAVKIESLIEQEKTYSLTFSPALTSLTSLSASFEFDLRPYDYAANRLPIFLTELSKRSNSHSILPLEIISQSSLFALGRVLIVRGKTSAMEVIVKDIDSLTNEIKVEPAIPGSELTGSGVSLSYNRFDTVIYGNTALTGHGESQSQKFLGSGDATQSNQEFDFEVKDISFESNREFPAGVRCAIDIIVEGRTWLQVANINDSGPEDAHYLVRMKEDGTLKMIFGDGIHGRRLPSGNNNIRIAYKLGVGLSGNLSPFSLEKALKPHHLIEGVIQPVATSGGNDMEAAESMRENAPASVLTLERAVSLSDFTHLTMSNSSVWQARAYRVKPGRARKEKIKVAVVPAGGGALGNLQPDLEAFLTSHGLPALTIEVVPFASLIFDLNVTIRVKDDAFDADFVTQEAKQTLLETFSLQHRKLGEPLYRSQIFHAVEAVQGVANCQCEIVNGSFKDASNTPVIPVQTAIGSNAAVKRVSANIQQVIYLDKALSNINLITQTFSL